MIFLKGQDRLVRIGQLNGDICNLRHELDGIAGYPNTEEISDVIEQALIMKEIQLCAAENGVEINDADAEKFAKEHAELLNSSEYLDDALMQTGMIPNHTARIVTVEVKQGICPICGHEIELDEVLSPFVTQYPEVFRYHCPSCGTTGNQTVILEQKYPVRHSNVIDGEGYRIILQEPKKKEEPTIPIAVVKNYLINLLDDWDKLGDRKYELPNMQVYNHIRTELDDLAKYCKEHGIEDPD